MTGDTNTAPTAMVEMLQEQTEETLVEMETRVQKSAAALEEMLRDLEQDREDLKVEKQQLEASISDILQSTHSLHISKENITGAKLQETSLHKVNRLASKLLFKGKETVQINENIGDLRHDPQAIATDGKQVHPPSVLQSRLQNSMASANKWFSQAQKTAQTAATEAATVASVGAKNVWAQVSEGRTASQHSQAVPPRVVSSTSLPDSEPGSSDGEDAAVLIELQITLEDERVVLLHVRAADRACWAAEKFLDENGLDPGLKDSLTKYLTQIEDDAECFPIHTEAHISDFS